MHESRVLIPRSSQHDFEQLLKPALSAAQHHTWYVVEKLRQKYVAACKKVRREASAARLVQASEAAVNDALTLMEQAGLRSLDPDLLRHVCEELTEPIFPHLLTTSDWSHTFPGDHKNEYGPTEGWDDVVGMMAVAVDREQELGEVSCVHDAAEDTTTMTFAIDGTEHQVTAPDASSKYYDRDALHEIALAVCSPDRTVLYEEDHYIWARTKAARRLADSLTA